MKVVIEPIRHTDGVVLFDIFIDNVWQGSERSEEEAKEKVLYLQTHVKYIQK